jgi:hypothetical protein
MLTSETSFHGNYGNDFAVTAGGAVKAFNKMKNKMKTIIGLAAVMLAGITQAQVTNMLPAITPQEQSLFQQAYDATVGTTNGIFVFPVARKMTGNVNRGGFDYIYSFNSNAGLVLGGDVTWGNGRQTSANILKGGIDLKADVYPFKNFGATNFFVTPFVSVLIATPLNGTSNNGGIGQLTVTGASYEHSFTKNLSLEVGGFYENVTGEGGGLDGNWLGALVGVHYKF